MVGHWPILSLLSRVLTESKLRPKQFLFKAESIAKFLLYSNLSCFLSRAFCLILSYVCLKEGRNSIIQIIHNIFFYLEFGFLKISGRSCLCISKM